MIPPEVLSALGPSVGIVVVVFAFLKHLNERDKKLTQSFDKNSQALEDNSSVLGQVLERLRDGE